MKRKVDKKMKSTQVRERVMKMVEKAIKTDDYNLIREASRLCNDETGVFFGEDETFVMVDDEVFYFNGAFGTEKEGE